MTKAGFTPNAGDSIVVRLKMAAAQAIAECINSKNLQSDYIIPSVFDTSVAKKVAKAVANAARNSGVARNRGRKKFV